MQLKPMISLLLMAVFGRQHSSLGPDLPPGINKTFALAAVRVEERLFALDFGGSGRAAALLTHRELAVDWDDSEVPASLKSTFQQERNKGFDIWRVILNSK